LELKDKATLILAIGGFLLGIYNTFRQNFDRRESLRRWKSDESRKDLAVLKEHLRGLQVGFERKAKAFVGKGNLVDEAQDYLNRGLSIQAIYDTVKLAYERGTYSADEPARKADALIQKLKHPNPPSDPQDTEEGQ
jgi:hypothetical protein